MNSCSRMVKGWPPSALVTTPEGMPSPQGRIPLPPFSVTSEGPNHWVQSSSGEVALVEIPRFPRPRQGQETGGYAAPMPGKVVAVNVEAGQAVNAGQLLIVLEAMKMEHRITCSEAGIVKELRVQVGQQVDAGQVMLVIEAGEGQQ